MAGAGLTCMSDLVVAIPQERRREAGVDRAVREVLALTLRGVDDHVVAGLIRRHASFRRPGGRTAWIRRLGRLRQEMPDRLADLEALAMHAMNCSSAPSDSDH